MDSLNQEFMKPINQFSDISEDEQVDDKTRGCYNCKYEHDGGYCDFGKSGSICIGHSAWEPK
jgi:hypothetical protein